VAVLLLPFVTSDDARAALGIADVEVPDQRFVDAGVQEALTIELMEWLPTYATIYTTGVASGATTAQAYQANLLRMYAITYAAYLIAFSELSIAQQIGDGKTGEKRFSTNFERMRELMKQRSDSFRGRLTESISGLETSRPALFGSAAPTYDPVTGV